MIAVIQCAASKRSDAGRLRTAHGVPVEFVADPQAAPADPSRTYARPDDLSDNRTSWRQLLVAYNQEPGSNPLGLYPAYQLYENRAYGRLVDSFGLSNVYVLSAGWGLIRADFLTPHYDITYSPSADKYKRRRKADRYHDFCMLPNHAQDDILFFGGKDYLPLFCSLTSAVQGKRIVFYNSASAPQIDRCTISRFETTTRTNWHYECVNAFLDGGIRVDRDR
ncbi:hypothetical protein [Bradyrhizobium elkanii]